ncbi:MAG: Crp/Fnr family transcriptional regulator [Micrococcaceae bacterium]
MLSIETLKQNPLFNVLDEKALAELENKFEEIELAQGETIDITDESKDICYLVLEGKIKITSPEQQGEKVFINNILGPSDMLGEYSLATPYPISVDATAVSNVKLAGIKKSILSDLLISNPKFNKAYIKRLVGTIAYNHVKQMNEAFSDVSKRVAAKLLDLSTRFGESQGDIVVVEHGLTQEEVAQLVGSSRETVNKAIANFVREELVDVGLKKFRILDETTLRDRAK